MLRPALYSKLGLIELIPVLLAQYPANAWRPGGIPRRADGLPSLKPKSKVCVSELSDGIVKSVSTWDGDDIIVPSTELPVVSTLVVDVLQP